MAKEKIKVIIKRPFEPVGRIREIDNTLEALQKAVDGYIEVVRIAEDGAIICNEEGRLFVKGIADGTYKPEDEEEAAKFLWQEALERYTVLDWPIFTRYLTKQETWNMSEEEKREEKKKYSTMNTAAILMVAVAAREQDTAVMDYLGKSIAHSTRLPQMYEALALYGYQPDKEEKQIIDGTHELYAKEEQA